MYKFKITFCVLLIFLILDLIPKYSKAIYEGHTASDDAYTFMVYILYKGKFQCAGAIISKVHVITSGQCVVLGDNDKKNYVVVSETTSTSPRKGRKLAVKYIWQHSEYFKHGSLAHNDIAIITINKNFGATLKSLKLPPAGKLPKIGSICHLTGWGACTEKSTRCSGRLKYIHVILNDQDSCKETASKWYELGPEHLCIEHGKPSGRAGASRGDVGAILSYKDYLVGIVTLPTADVHQERPDIYTKPGVFLHLHEKVIQKERILEKEGQSSKICQPRSQSNVATSTIQQQRVPCYHDYTCVKVSETEQGESESSPSTSRDSNQPGTSKDINDPEAGNKRPSKSKKFEVGSKRFCVPAENIQNDPERYYKITPQSYKTIAQQNNIQPSDVAELKCRTKTDDDEAFISYLLFGNSASPPNKQEELDAQSSEAQIESLKERWRTPTTTPDQQGSENYPLQLPPSPASSDSSWDSGSESDLLNYQPRPMPPQPDFTPPRSD